MSKKQESRTEYLVSPTETGVTIRREVIKRDQWEEWERLAGGEEPLTILRPTGWRGLVYRVREWIGF